MDDHRIEDAAQSPEAGLSRRMALRLGGGGLAAALVAGGVWRATEAQSTLSTATTTIVPPIVQSWIAAWNSTNVAANLQALYTADGIYEDVPTDRRSQPGAIQNFLAAFVRGLSGIQLQLRDAFGTANWATAEFVFSAVNEGTYAGLTGKRFSVRYATVFQLRGPEIARSSDYYNLGTILAQLAPPPPPPTVATPRPATPAPVVRPATPPPPATVPATAPPATVPATAPATVPATAPATAPTAVPATATTT